jgi:hypothetical protein
MTARIVQLNKANDGIHKYIAYISCGCSGKYIKNCPNKKVVKFGADGYSDFIQSKGDEEKKNSYVKRHKDNEDWSKKGIYTAGFWSRWLLWNKPTLKESIKDIEDRFNLDIIY